MLGFCCPGTLLLSAKYNLFCSRRCLKIGNMPSSERFFRQTKPIWRRNTWCIPRKIGNVWRKKSRRLGMLTIFKRALSQVKTWLRVFLWREGLTLLWNDFCQCAESPKSGAENCRKCSRAYGRNPDETDSGIGHSVIRGLDTTGQWSAASSTVLHRGSQKCHQRQIVDS